MARPNSIPAVVIGAVPYGLSITAHLRGRGVPTRTFGEVMISWRERMPAGMILKSTPNATSISAPHPGSTLHDFYDLCGVRRLREEEQIPIDMFIRYGQWFQQRYVPDVEAAQVSQLDQSDGRFHLKLDTGEELETRAVVMASGLISFPYVPAEFAAAVPDGPSPDRVLSHSSQLHDLTGFSGRDVAVIGAGQSALEGAALLHEAGANVQLFARHQARFGDPPPAPAGLRRHLPQPASPLGPTWKLYPFSHAAGMYRYLPQQSRLSLARNVLGPLGGWWLAPRVVGQFPVHEDHRVLEIRADSGKAVLVVAGPDGRQSDLKVDHVVAATGYRVDLNRIDYLSAGVRTRMRSVSGYPHLSPSFETSVPGLYVAGMAAAETFGPLMRFVCGTSFAAPRVTTSVRRSYAAV
jgi:cation diffusion facilitator CzcD-associated flavoprotein CzcO